MVNLNKWKAWAKRLKREIDSLYFACKDPRTPFFAKCLAAIVVAYAFSPIDLVPDFIPVLGYLDDLILIPLGIALVIKLIPKEILQETRIKAQKIQDKKKPKNWIAAALIMLIWLIMFTVIVICFFYLLQV